jgi:hypothetical protein
MIKYAEMHYTISLGKIGPIIPMLWLAWQELPSMAKITVKAIQ